LEFELPKTNGEVLMITTSESGKRFRQTKHWFGKQQATIDPLFLLRSVVNIDRFEKFQKFIGFGTHFTGAVSYNIDLVPTLSESIYKSYFCRETGLGFSMMRIPIGGTDADLEPWAYNEIPENDEKLMNFTRLDQRDVKRIDQLKDLMKVSGNSDIKFIGTAWR
jgi:glucosylceramidase